MPHPTYQLFWLCTSKQLYFKRFFFGFRMEHVFRQSGIQVETQNVFRRAFQTIEKISMILTFFFVFNYITLLGVIPKNFLLWHVYPLDQQYLIMIFHVFSLLVLITLCIPVMINSLESSHWPQQCWHYLALSCQSK